MTEATVVLEDEGVHADAVERLVHEDRTLVDVLHRRADADGERTAYTFLVDGEHIAQVLSHGELASRARRVAGALAPHGTAAARAILLYPPGLDFIVGLYGCFLAGVVAVPVYPPDPHDPAAGLRHVQRVADDAGASIVLTTDGLWAWAEAWAEQVPRLMELEWCATDALTAESAAAWQRPIITADRVAFLQYTSGSTASPRGVMVTHRNLMAHGSGVGVALGLSPSSVVVSWLPLYHDMGLIGTILVPMQIGFPSVQMSPLAFLERPIRWLRALSRFGGTLSPAPNFAYDLCVRRTSPAERQGLDLARWVAAMNGAEPVRAETCERFLDAFSPYGFRRDAFVPCYGLAEATLMVAGGPAGRPFSVRSVDGASLARQQVVTAAVGSEGSRKLVPCGAVLPGQEVVTVDPETRRPCEYGRVGELWVRGSTVAAGYWNRPDESACVFDARIADGDHRGRFLRTGDLGFVQGGVVFVTGRLKDLIIVHGRNYYPQDIERTVEGAHPALRPGCGAAFAIESPGGERLAIVHEVALADAILSEAVVMAIRNAVAREHGVCAEVVTLIQPRTLLRTSSGKVRRAACRDALLAGQFDVVASWRTDASAADGSSAAPTAGVVANRLIAMVAELRGIPREMVRTTDALVALGIDSAEAAQLAAGLESWLCRPVALRTVLAHPTIESLAAALSGVPS